MFECDHCGKEVHSPKITKVFDDECIGGSYKELCNKCLAEYKGDMSMQKNSRKEERQDMARARAYHDFRVELWKSDVEHSQALIGYSERCWCGNFARHKVIGRVLSSMGDDDVARDLFLCTEHFSMWFKLPDHKWPKKSKEKRKADKLARKIKAAEEAGGVYIAEPPFDEWGERQISLNCQFDPPMIFTGKKIAEQAVNSDHGQGAIYFTIYQQTVKPKSYYVSITLIGRKDQKKRCDRHTTYWVEEVEFKKDIPSAIKKYIKTWKRPRGSYEARIHDNAMQQMGETIRLLYADLKLRVPKDQKLLPETSS